MFKLLRNALGRSFHFYFTHLLATLFIRTTESLVHTVPIARRLWGESACLYDRRTRQVCTLPLTAWTCASFVQVRLAWI